MSVFHNTYVENYQKEIQRIKDNRLTEDFKFFDIYYTTLLNTFKWKGQIPDELPNFLIEEYYQSAGRIGSFFDKDEFLILPIFPTGSLTKYGEFTSYDAVDATGKIYRLDARDVVVGFNNCSKIPYIQMVYNFAKKSSYALRAVDVSLRRVMRGPIISGLSDTQIKTIGSALGDDNSLKEVLALPSANGLDDEKINRFSLFDNRETDILSLWDVYTRYRNLYYTTFGINNIEIQKRERLTQAEGSGNDEIVRYSLLDDMKNRREKWCEDNYKKFKVTLDFDVQRDAMSVFELNRDNADKIREMEIAITRGSNLNVGGDDNEGKTDTGIADK